MGEIKYGNGLFSTPPRQAGHSVISLVVLIFQCKRVIRQCKKLQYLLNSLMILFCLLFQSYNFIFCKQKEREANHEITSLWPCIQAPCFRAGRHGGRKS